MNTNEIYKKNHLSEFLFLLIVFFSFQLEPNKNYKGTFNKKVLKNQLLEIFYNIQILSGQNLKPNVGVCDRCVNSDSEF